MNRKNAINKILIAASLFLSACLSPLTAFPAVASSEADLHFERALQYEFQNNSGAAISEYRRGLEVEPNSVDGHVRLGTLLLEQVGDVDGAISEFVTALGIDPNCAYCQMHLNEAVDRLNSTAAQNIARGNDYYRSGQYLRALAAYRVAVFLSPQNAEAHNSIAWTLYKLGNLEEAMPEIKEALKLKPEDAEYINTLACILYDKGDVDGALSNWQRAILRSKKPNAADLYGLAIGLLAKGETQRAIENFKETIKTDANFADVIYLRDRIGLSVHAVATHDKLMSLSGLPAK